MTEAVQAVQALVTGGPSASRRRRPLPPRQVALGFCLLLCGRFINSQLMFDMSADVELSLWHVSFLLITTTFWFWPAVAGKDPTRQANPWPRGILLTAFWCLVPYALSVVRYHPHEVGVRILLLVLPVGIYNSALLYPFPKLFANLRLDRTIPASSALGPCAMFFFYALMVPAVAESLRSSSTYLHWIRLGVPPLTAVLVALDLRERRADRGWWRELAGLLWKTALLPFLFLLGEAGIVALGISSGY
jgi:hypothetical protein